MNEEVQDVASSISQGVADCSPRDKMTLNSIILGSKPVSMMWLTTLACPHPQHQKVRHLPLLDWRPT
jgi:hypothetical protein